MDKFTAQIEIDRSDYEEWKSLIKTEGKYVGGALRLLVLQDLKRLRKQETVTAQ